VQLTNRVIDLSQDGHQIMTPENQMIITWYHYWTGWGWNEDSVYQYKFYFLSNRLLLFLFHDHVAYPFCLNLYKIYSDCIIYFLPT
jgi:hypothetical protein